MALLLLVLSGLAGAGAGLLLQVRPGYVDLLDPASPLQRRYLDLLSELGNVEPLYVLVESDDPARAAAFVDAFALRVAALRDEEGRFLAGAIVSRVDLDDLLTLAPALLPAPTLERLAAQPVATEARRNAVALLLRTTREIVVAEAQAVADGAPRDADRATPDALAAALDGVSGVLTGDAPPVAASLIPPGWLHGLDSTGHLQAGPGRLVMTVMPADASNDYRMLTGLLSQARAVARELEPEHGGVRVAFTGAPALIVDEMTAVRRDVALASTLSFVLVTLLFLVSFNSLRHVAFAAVANACGLALTFGAAWLLVGYLNLFSSVFAAVLAGLGIDFGVHFLNYYEARRREGHAAEPAVVDAFRTVLPPIALSAVTTAAAFLTIMTSEFAGFAQLGLISGVGVLLCLLTAFTLVPALLAWEARRRPAHPPGSREPWSVPFLLIPVRAARVAAPLALVLVALAAVGASRLRFDHDLMNLQPAGTEAVSLQKGSERRLGTHPAFSLAASVEVARQRAQAFRELPSVASVQSPADLLPEPDAARNAALAALAAVADSAAGAGRAAEPPLDAESLARDCLAEAEALHASLVELQDLAFEGGSADDVSALEAPVASAAALVASLRAPGAAPRLAMLQSSLAERIAAAVARLPRLAEGVTPQDLPSGLKGLVGRSGRLAIAVIPKEPVWDRDALKGFLADVRAVDPDVTGPAVQVGEIPEMMRVSLLRAAALSLAVIAVMVLLTTRRLATTVLSMVPLACGFVLMLGSMKWLGVPLNPANLIALPLLLGIGVDGGVHLVHRWEETRDASRAVVDVGHALLITSLTTVAGFLPLLLARHRGIRSLGAAACLGSLGMLLAACVIAPAFLAVLDEIRDARRRS